MERRDALIGSAAFLVIAPGTVAGVIPWLATHWRFGDDATLTLNIIGGLLILMGLAALIESFVRFALQGAGTPAPVAPTQKLVVTGLYRHVRNPMYVAVLTLIFGQALFFADAALLAYWVAMALTFHIFVATVEEPRLKRDFGEAYETYCANVRRWLPRLSPWRPAPQQS